MNCPSNVYGQVVILLKAPFPLDNPQRLPSTAKK